MTHRVVENPSENVAAIPGASPQEVKAESNPFTSTDPRMLTYAWMGLLVRFLLVAGGIFSVWQYLQQREEQRVERSLSLVQLWEQPTYQEAQKALRDRIADLNERHEGLLGETPTDRELALYRDRIGMAAMTGAGGTMPLDEFEDHFGRIVYFLNRVAFCVEGRLCSGDVTDAYFLDYANSFWSYFSAYILRERREGRARYAEAVGNYVDRSR